MPDTRTVKKIFNWKPLTKRSQGRPKYRWEDNIKQDICQLKIQNWIACVQDRGKWEKKGCWEGQNFQVKEVQRLEDVFEYSFCLFFVLYFRFFLFCVFFVFVLFFVLFPLLCWLFPIFCTIYRPLPPGGNPLAINRYIDIKIMTCHNAGCVITMQYIGYYVFGRQGKNHHIWWFLWKGNCYCKLGL